MAYIAAVMAHPAFTARFRADLVRPGLRLPITADAELFERAVALGREVIWLHTYGERMVDEDAGRPPGPPRLANDGADHPHARARSQRRPSRLPERACATTPPPAGCSSARATSTTSRQAMVDYDVSGMNVLTPMVQLSQEAIAAARSSATAARPRRCPTSSPITGSPSTPATCSTSCTCSAASWLSSPRKPRVLEDILGATLLEHEQLVAAGALGATETGARD